MQRLPPSLANKGVINPDSCSTTTGLQLHRRSGVITAAAFQLDSASFIYRVQSRRKDPPYPPVGGSSRMLRGLMLRRRAVLGTPKCENLLVAGAPPRTPLGELAALPRPPSCWRGGFAAPSPRTPLTILSLCLSCVYVHTCRCMKMHCYFPLNVKHGGLTVVFGGPPTI